MSFNFQEGAMNRKRIALLILACLLAALLLSGCASVNQAQDTAGTDGVAGFWAGLWQGLILPVSFIISLFKDDMNIYEIHNNGNWYNFGFVFGTWIIFGSILASKQGRK
jgi:uncharacterized membrane protein YdcZ (DUF606 family)